MASHFHTSRIYNDTIFFARLNEKGGGGKREGVFYYTLHLKVHFRSCHFIQCTIADTLQACKYFITECLLEFAFKRGCAVLSNFFLIKISRGENSWYNNSTTVCAISQKIANIDKVMSCLSLTHKKAKWLLWCAFFPLFTCIIQRNIARLTWIGKRIGLHFHNRLL